MVRNTHTVNVNGIELYRKHVITFNCFNGNFVSCFDSNAFVFHLNELLVYQGFEYEYKGHGQMNGTDGMKQPHFMIVLCDDILKLNQINSFFESNIFQHFVLATFLLNLML